MCVFYKSYSSDISCLRRELRLIFVEGISTWRKLVTVLRVKELRVTLVEVIHKKVVGNVCEVKKIIHFRWLFSDWVEVDTNLLSDRVLSTRIVQKFLFRNSLKLLINLVKAECSHDKYRDHQLKKRAEPSTFPADEVFAHERTHVPQISTHIMCIILLRFLL